MNTVLKVEQGGELLKSVFAAWPEVKKNQVRLWLKHGALQVNGVSQCRHDFELKAGDTVTVRREKFARPDLAMPSGIVIRHEDKTLLIVEKPAGLLSVGTDSDKENTVYWKLNAYLKRRNPDGKDRIFIVHRLDRETSGLLIFAKTEQAKRLLQQNWNTVIKRYRAVVEGVPVKAEGELRHHLKEIGDYRVTVVRAEERGQLAVTRYKVVDTGVDKALVELELETGRKNQIRVQLSAVGHPIVGDDKYGAKTDPARRLLLHSAYLSFEHPDTGKRMEMISPFPKGLWNPKAPKKAAPLIEEKRTGRKH